MAKKAKKKKDVTEGFEKLIQGKELEPNNGQLFERAIKKAATTKKVKR